jgi:class 3 adenylate cyclase
MPDVQQHRLAAIMFTDIVGYSALMHQSEEKAIRILEKNRNLHKTLIDLYHGKYLKEIGDGTLACFEAASDAVRCATELQRVAKEDPDLKLHVGIHLGEVIFSNNDVFGDGVNIASRIDAVAKEGEIYISEDVWKNIKNKEGIHTEYLGKQKFKNIKDPIGLYKLTDETSKTSHWLNRLEIKSLKKVFYPCLFYLFSLPHSIHIQ